MRTPGGSGHCKGKGMDPSLRLIVLILEETARRRGGGGATFVRIVRRRGERGASGQKEKEFP